MSLTDFLLLAAVLCVAYAIVAPHVVQRPSRPEAPPPEVTRWRRFRIRPRLMAGRPGQTFLTEDPRGWRWQTLAEARGGRRLRCGPDRRHPLVDVRRPRLLAGSRVVLRLEGRPWLRLRPQPDGRPPRLEPCAGHPGLDAPAPSELSLQGDLAAREYEVRLAGRLVVSSSRQVGDLDRRAPAEGEDDASDYWIEVIKGAPAAPLLALALALEVLVPARTPELAKTPGPEEKRHEPPDEAPPDEEPPDEEPPDEEPPDEEPPDEGSEPGVTRAAPRR